jgi:hypothetical protein
LGFGIGATTATLDDLTAGGSTHAGFFFDLSGEMMLHSPSFGTRILPGLFASHHGLSRQPIPADL